MFKPLAAPAKPLAQTKALGAMLLHTLRLSAISACGLGVLAAGVCQADAPSAVQVFTRPAAVPVVVKSVIGHVRATSCTHRLDLREGAAEALQRLQETAASRGANGLVDVQSLLITNNRSPCWHGFEATGTAVILASAE